MARSECLVFLVVLLGFTLHADTDSAAEARVRQPAVSGRWYPAERRELEQTVDSLLETQPATRVSGRIRALIAPHAGYAFSGRVAAQGFSQVPADVERVIILAPAHTVRMRGGGSVLDVDYYRTPLGDIPVAAAASELREQHGFLASLARAHAKEWSLEVMLPFLQRRLTHFELIPVVLGYGFDAGRVAEALQPLLEGPKTLIVASSDLSHDQPYAKAVQLDSDCIHRILAHDMQGLDGKRLCGKEPVSVLVEVAERNGWFPTLIDYKNSGDTTGNREARIVGYTCIAFTSFREGPDEDGTSTSSEGADAREGYEGKRFSSGEEVLLLDLARRSIWASLAKEALPGLPMYSDTLTQTLGCFVTLHKEGKLRGCIGNIFPKDPLVQAVQTNALGAAFRDRRFSAVTEPELAELKLEISILTVPRELTYQDAGDLLRQLRPGAHGVVVTEGTKKRATYLPQVWAQIPDPVYFLSRLCRKGGMSSAAWRDPGKTTVQVYEAYAFEEE